MVSHSWSYTYFIKFTRHRKCEKIITKSRDQICKKKKHKSYLNERKNHLLD